MAASSKFGTVALTFPLQAAAATDQFHGGDGGFSFASAGVTAAVPLSFLPGKWALNAGLTYYYTDQDVIPSNVNDSFLTGTVGLGLTF